MKITRKSLISGIMRTKDLPITKGQLVNWQNGTLIHHAFPNLSDDDREFLMTGISPEEWEEFFKEEY